jgi:predicted S18 family serine protease
MEKLNIELRWKREKRPLGPPRRWVALIAVAVVGTVWAEPGGADAASSHRLVTVPALAVSSTQEGDGGVHYVVIQVDQNSRLNGPIVLFDESSFRGGSVVGQEWKDAAQVAVIAAANAVGRDPRGWTVVIKNHAPNTVIDGKSAGSAVAVGVMAAWKGHRVRPDVVMTGAITADGRILEVDDLPGKLAGAARANFTTLLVPRGQTRSPHWNLAELAAQRRMTVIEIGSLQEAYDLMTEPGP